MQAMSDKTWIDNARAAFKVLRSGKTARTRVPVKSDFPPPPPITSRLRGLEQTQDLDELESKGKIVNRYT